MIHTIVERLTKPRKVGANTWQACCPAHDDKTPSLRVTIRDSGVILIHCFAGCAPSDILASIGLEMSDLFPDRGLGDHFRGWHPSMAERAKREEQAEKDELILELAEAKRASGIRMSRKEMEVEVSAWTRLNASQDSQPVNRNHR